MKPARHIHQPLDAGHVGAPVFRAGVVQRVLHGHVHHLGRGAVVPIGWIAVGDPARILPPGRHEEIWAIQQELDFPGTVYGVARSVA